MTPPLRLPVGEVPDPPPPRMTYDEFIAWNAELRRRLPPDLLDRLRNDPARQPSPERFVLK